MTHEELEEKIRKLKQQNEFAWSQYNKILIKREECLKENRKLKELLMVTNMKLNKDLDKNEKNK